MKRIDIGVKPSRKYDGERYRVKEILQQLQTDADRRKDLMTVYDDLREFQDCIDNMVENIWLCFVEESCFNYKPPVLLIAFAWYYGLKEGIITKGMPYDQVVYLVRRKVVFRLVDVQMNFK